MKWKGKIDFECTPQLNGVDLATVSGLHDQSHAVTSTADHSANNWKLFYSDGSGDVQELALGPTAGDALTTTGASSAPVWTTISGVEEAEISKYVTTISAWTPSGGIYYADVTHSLGTNDLLVEAYTTADNKTVELEDIDRTDTNTIRIWSATNTENIRIVVLSVNEGVAPGPHTIQSHSDTSATGAQLNELVGGGETILHTHSGTGAPESHGNEAHDSTFITAAGVTYENLNANGDVGTGAAQVAQGDHTHSYLADVVDDTSPQLGGDLDLNTKNINYGSILTSNGTYEGEIMTLTVDDGSSAFGKVLAQAADFNYDLADADAATQSMGLVMALESGSGSKKVLLQGQICDTSWNWSYGLLYLSTTAGDMTQTAPSGSGDQVIVLGWALSADTIFFRPSLVLVEVA